MTEAAYELAAEALIKSRIELLRAISYAQAASLPEAESRETIIADQTCTLSVFMQNSPHALPRQVLVTVQVARRDLLSLASYNTERGLVFSADGGIREATDEELRNSGG